MQLQLPLPYPDELLYSVIARYQSHIGPVGDCPLINAVFGRMCHMQIDMPPSLDQVSQRTFALWGLTALDLALLHTLFPYYAYSTDRAALSVWSRSLFFLNTMGKRLPLGAEKVWKNFGSRLQLCPECHAADMSRYGESYWRRLHQLPGVLICPQHECFLQLSMAAYHPLSAPRFVDATTVLGIKDSGKATHKSSLRAMALRIARRSRDLLDSPALIAANIHGDYQVLLEAIGFLQPSASDRYINALVDCIGSEFLDAVGIKPSSMSWLHNIAQSKPYLFHTLEHIVFQTFLESYLPTIKQLQSRLPSVNRWGDKSFRTSSPIDLCVALPMTQKQSLEQRNA